MSGDAALSVVDATDATVIDAAQEDAGPDAAVDAEAGTTKVWKTPVRVSAAADGDVLAPKVSFSPTENRAAAVWLSGPHRVQCVDRLGECLRGR